MSKYSITISKQARKQLRDIPRKDRLRISGAIELLGDNPIPPKALKLTNRDGYRLRVGDYRIIYIFNLLCVCNFIFYIVIKTGVLNVQRCKKECLSYFILIKYYYNFLIFGFFIFFF